jgi:hypothetical protein
MCEQERNPFRFQICGSLETTNTLSNFIIILTMAGGASYFETYKSVKERVAAAAKKQLQPARPEQYYDSVSTDNSVQDDESVSTYDQEDILFKTVSFPSIVNNPAGIIIDKAKRRTLRIVCLVLTVFMQIGFFSTYFPAYLRSPRPATPTVSLLLDEDRTMTVVGLLFNSTYIPFATVFVSLFTSSAMLPAPVQKANATRGEIKRGKWILEKLHKIKGDFCFPLWFGFLSFVVFVVCTQLIFVVSVTKNFTAHYIVTLMLTFSASWFHTAMATKRWYKFNAFELLFGSDDNKWIETFGFREWWILMYLNMVNLIILWVSGFIFFMQLVVVGYESESFTHWATAEYVYFHVSFFLFFFFVLDIYNTQ